MESFKPILSSKAVFASYLFAIKNSLGSPMFQEFYLEDDDSDESVEDGTEEEE